MPDFEPVLKRARHLNSHGNETGIELQTSLETQPGGVIFSRAELFNNVQPNANLSSDIMHSSTGPACDVPVNVLTNQELNSRGSLMDLGETELPPMQPVSTHKTALRSNASHTESGGG